MKKVMRAGGPIIWAHASTPAALDAMLEVLLRAQMIEPSLSYVLSAPASEYIFDIEVVRLQEANLQSGQDFLSKMLPDLCLWADDNISIPLFELIQRCFQHLSLILDIMAIYYNNIHLNNILILYYISIKLYPNHLYHLHIHQ